MKSRIQKLKVKLSEATKEGECGKLRSKLDEESSLSVIVHSKAIPHLLKLLKHAGKGTVTLDYKAGVVHPAPPKAEAGKPPPRYVIDEPPRLRVTSENLLLVTKCVLGNYPNWRQVIPTEAKECVDVDVEAWLNALRTVEPFTSEKHNAVKLHFTDLLLTMTTNSPDVGTGKATVPINGYVSKEFTMSYNPAYLIEALNVLKDDEHVKFGFTDELSPCVITTLKTVTVIMPMRLS